MATVHPHLLFSRELKVLADIHHPNVTESDPQKTRRKGEKKAQQRMKGGELARRGWVGGWGGGYDEESLGKGGHQRKDKCPVKLVDTEKEL